MERDVDGDQPTARTQGVMVLAALLMALSVGIAWAQGKPLSELLPPGLAALGCVGVAVGAWRVRTGRGGRLWLLLGVCILVAGGVVALVVR